MGLVYTEITLINGEDLVLAKRHIIGEDEIKKMTVNMLVDTGSVYMCINETVQEQLDLPVVQKRKGRLANGSIEDYNVVGREVRFRNRRCDVDAMVLPGYNERLLGAIPLEDMPACRISSTLFKILNKEPIKLNSRAGTFLSTRKGEN